MKRKRRFEPPVFNPEKFLEKEKKQTASKPSHPGLFLPVSFSKERLQALIARIQGDRPEAFDFGRVSPKYTTLAAFWKKEIAKELAVYGIAPDPLLVLYLLAGVVNHPLYKKTARERKDA